MPDRADAHAHLFYPGYVAKLDATCRRIQPDEVTLYEALRKLFDIKQLLAVGYEGSDEFAGNNDYLAGIAAARPWVRPAAYFHEPAQVTLEALRAAAAKKFVGVSFYLFSRTLTDQLTRVPEEVWRWMIDRRWLISVNSQGEHWSVWRGVLDRFPDLRVIVSHLGLPGVIAAPSEAAGALSTVTALAAYPEVRVKLSGFYALSQPGYDYPHRNAWPLVELLRDSFGPDRLLWGSDFSPSLEHLGFPQTFGLFGAMPFLTDADRARIEGGNLIELLEQVR